MFDQRFGWSSDGSGYRHKLSSKKFASLDEAHADFAKEVSRREEAAGRALTATELRDGIARPDARSDREKREAARRYQGELNPVVPDDRSTAVKYRDDLLAEKEAASRAALSPRERRLLRAEQAVAEEQAAATQAAAREAALSTDAGKRVRRDLTAAIEHAMYDPSVSQETLDELRHQAALLDRFGDIAAVGRNLSTIRTAIVAGVTAQADTLRASADRISAKAAALNGASEPPKPAADIKSLLQP